MQILQNTCGDSWDKLYWYSYTSTVLFTEAAQTLATSKYVLTLLSCLTCRCSVATFLLLQVVRGKVNCAAEQRTLYICLKLDEEALWTED